MQAKNTLILSVLCFVLGACSISVEGEGEHYRARNHHWDGGQATVKLPNGESVTFGCPEGTSLFIRDDSDKGGDLVYGCRAGNHADDMAQD